MPRAAALDRRGRRFGFNETGASWLPQPAVGDVARDVQQADPVDAHLYTRLLELARASHSVTATWSGSTATARMSSPSARGALYVVANLGDDPVDVGGDGI